MILTFPVNCWWVNDKTNYFNNLIKVLRGKISFVGFSSKTTGDLPYIKKGILSMYEWIEEKYKSSIENSRANTIYACDYSVKKDLSIVLNLFKMLGKKI